MRGKEGADVGGCEEVCLGLVQSSGPLLILSSLVGSGTITRPPLSAASGGAPGRQMISQTGHGTTGFLVGNV